ncbi:hypothetical protein BASA81_000734 [Batrachochytrium salamandrivorans]|nr:hypothetical protein BASA81_000734 [Batrachochytrium salamandrivorans]
MFGDGHCIVKSSDGFGGKDNQLVLLVGTCPEDWPRVLSHTDCHVAVGIHPWNVSPATSADSLALLESHLRSDHRLRVGEIGLDKSFRYKSTFELQKQWFREQWKLAQEWNRSVSVHCVRAHGTLVEIANELGLPSGGVFLHSFSGSQEVARALLRMPGEVYFGVSKKINLGHFVAKLQLVVPRPTRI